MRESTAEIWIGPDQSNDFYGTGGGLNPTWLLLLRENSRPAWMLMAGNLYDAKPPTLGRPGVWVPSRGNSLEDALVMFSVCGALVPEMITAVRGVVGQESLAELDIDKFSPDGFPDEIYEACRRHLGGWHVVVSAGEYSLIAESIEVLKQYRGLTAEARLTAFRTVPSNGDA